MGGRSQVELRELERAADCDISAGRIIDALRKYDQILRAGKEHARIYRKAGEGLLCIKEFAQAISFFRETLAHGDDSAAVHHNLGRALFNMGAVDAAVQCLRETQTRTERIDPWFGLANILPNAPFATHSDVLEARKQWARRAKAMTVIGPRWPVRAHGGKTIRVVYLGTLCSAQLHEARLGAH